MTKQFLQPELRQSLKMTTSLQQSINMLQMSSLELSQFALQELAKNPFLEDEKISEDHIREQTQPVRKEATYDDNYDIFSNLATTKTLKDHITEQINIEISNHQEKLIAHYLLDLLQGNGYIIYDNKAVALQLKCPENLVNRVLTKLQKFEPAGIFARNLAECLILQLQEKNLMNNKYKALISNIELLASGELARLSKICQADLAELKQMISVIKSLNPKPASGFATEQTMYKIPDVILTILANNTIKLELNPEAVPQLKVNQEYYLKIKPSLVSKEDKEFTKQEFYAASNIVKSIEQRTKTILKVATCIAEQQIDFFTRGVMFLKPLTLSMIAQLTELNESTISRSTANKYISTPNGIFELKYFFSSSVSSKSANVSISSTKVKELIKQIIQSEESDSILSDDEIATHLLSYNIKVARRTVAKYREALGIPTSSIRKRQISLSSKLASK